MKPSLIFPLLTLMAAAPLPAATLGTLSLSSAGSELVTWNTWKAQSFSTTTDALTSPVVSSVTLRLEVIVPNAYLIVRVVGSGGSPGRPDLSDVRAELRPTAMPGDTAVTSVTFANDNLLTFPPLESGTTYWLVAGITQEDNDQPSPAGLVRWRFAATQGQDPGADPGWTVGSSIASSGTAGADWNPAVETPMIFEMTTVPVPVPEPTAGGLGLVGCLFLMHRRCRAHAPC